MSSWNIYALIEQIQTWFKAYQQVYEKINPPTIYRVVDIKRNKKNEIILTVQVIGRAVVLEYSPIDIVKDTRLLESFSKQDVRTISWLAQQELCMPKYRILSQILDSEKTIFRLQKIGDNNFIDKSAEELSLDPEIINGLSAEDALLVGYTCASEKNLSNHV